MPNLRITAPFLKFLPSCCAALLSALLLTAFISCNGNGGTSEMDGDIYNPGGGGVSGTGTGANGGPGGSEGSPSSLPSAIDILEMSNAGNTDGILAAFRPGTDPSGDEAQSQTITLDADAIGLTPGGTVTLAITGRGVDYNVTASADADGKVTFTVPAIVTGTEVTVTLVVKAAGGSVLFAGSKTQVLDGSASSLSISLSRQYWAMPASISAAASPATIAYEPGSVDSDTVTFNIIGLSDAPAGVSYSWTDESGAVVGTGPSLTRTVSQMLGGSVPSSETLEKAYSVSVSYTDASGESRTLTASAAATIVTTTTLTLEGSGIQTSEGRMVLAVPKGSAAVSLHADVLCFGGTPSYSWTLADGSAAAPTATLSGTTGQDNSVSFGPAGGSATVTVSADLGDGRILTRELYVYVLDAVISCGDIAAGGTAAIITEEATDSTVMTASLSGIASLPDVTYEWQVDDIAVALTGGAAASVGGTATITPVAAGSTSVRLRASYLGVSSGWCTQELKVAGLRISLGGAAAGDVVMKLSDTTGKTLSASVVNGSGTASFTWAVTEGSSATLDDTTGSSRTLAPGSAGGKSVVTVSTNVNGRPLSKELTVYVFDLALSGGTSLSAPTPSNTHYGLFLTTSDTAGTAVTASLNGTGMPTEGVYFTWTCADPALNYIMMDDSDLTHGRFTVKPKAPGTTSFSVMAYYNGSLTPVCSKTVDVVVAGITLTGDDTKVYVEASSLGLAIPGANNFGLTATLVGISPGGIVGGIAGITFESDDTSVATVAADTDTATSRDAIATALKGGKVTITARATIFSTGTVLTAKKEIPIIRPRVTYGSGTAVPATGSINLADGPATLTAELEGLTEGVSFAWECTPASGVDIRISDTSGPTTTVSSYSPGTATVTLTATYDGSDYEKTIGFDVTYSCAYTSLAALKTFLNGITGTDAAHPAKVNITGLTAGNWADLNTALKDCPSVFVDLSATALPDGITSMNPGFYNCRNLVVLPAIPASVINMHESFSNCRSLTDVSGLSIPASVTNMENCFLGCTNLTTTPDLSACTSLTSMKFCFSNCRSLTDVSGLSIPAGVTNMVNCFEGCDRLTTAPVIPAGVTNMLGCFNGCTNLSGTVTINASIIDSDKWDYAFKNVTGVTVQVPDCDTKDAIEAATGNSGVTVVVAGGTTCP